MTGTDGPASQGIASCSFGFSHSEASDEEEKSTLYHFQAVTSARCIVIEFRCTRMCLRVRPVFLALFYCVSERFTSIPFHEEVALFCVVNAFPLV